MDMREKHRLVAFYMHPAWGSNPQPRHVPSLEIEPATFHFARWHPPIRALIDYSCLHQLLVWCGIVFIKWWFSNSVISSFSDWQSTRMKCFSPHPYPSAISDIFYLMGFNSLSWCSWVWCLSSWLLCPFDMFPFFFLYISVYLMYKVL